MLEKAQKPVLFCEWVRADSFRALNPNSISPPHKYFRSIAGYKALSVDLFIIQDG